MPDIHIHRQHRLGFTEARNVGYSWAEKAQRKFDMECTYEEGDAQDTLYFSRAGVKGTLLVDARQFEMKAELGFLFGAFKARIEAEIGEQLDALLNTPRPAARKAAPAKRKAPANDGAEHKTVARTPAKAAAQKA
ncbi:MAG: polyhydroxyalkanoic acid system family protein [Gammaproteobacteria bacterium]|uniref:polyhydroxyalkanoic acid system family protein n=1 Tax=Acidovorax sp. JG5 TaxID=2822718 RepID=UPI001B33A782|nr:polyhydroxyalkanoic acid system family protein [Acidovorax sp. JG5]MBU4422427.1 polyhydroxyalkanoic acid system family protein [Gammaproteobacteria bacterium]